VTGFLILATILVAGALLFVLPPMFGLGHRRRVHADRQRQADTALVVLREQLADIESEHALGKLSDEDYARSREELEARALEEGRAANDGSDVRPASIWALALVLVVPASAALIYLSIGEPDALDPVKVAGQADPGHQITPDQMVGLVAQLAERLEQDPSDPTGWMMLVRSYAMLGDLDGAAATWRRIGEKAPEDADILADWADILVAGQDGDFRGEPDRLVAKALTLDPDNIKALALAGTADFQRGNYAAASAYWEKILAQISSEEDAYGSVLSSVNEARGRAGLPLLVAGAPPVSTGSEAAPDTGLKISGTLSVSPDLSAGVNADETVFVFVRPIEGGVPLAALRFRVADLPVEFSFDGVRLMSEAPLPKNVVVAARLSRQGDATARPGDLEGASESVGLDAAGVNVVIDTVRE
jgi:cytochrome c-type biogenesis protein CcmH